MQDFKTGFATLFLNSNSTDNSLEDVLTVPRLKDGAVSAELQNMFKEDYQEFTKSIKKENVEEKKNNVSDITRAERKRERIRGL